ncbi:MAG TPA: hypothetical protein VN181_06745 [Thermoanaerobaculia bacterium]|nr:hypothetical protein [Thermoanaerobaculia bacterium]
MATEKPGNVSAQPRSAISFEEFVEVATSSALRAISKSTGGADLKQLHWPIWFGWVIGPGGPDILKGGGPQGGGPLGGG